MDNAHLSNHVEHLCACPSSRVVNDFDDFDIGARCENRGILKLNQLEIIIHCLLLESTMNNKRFAEITQLHKFTKVIPGGFEPPLFCVSCKRFNRTKLGDQKKRRADDGTRTHDIFVGNEEL
jgi:hypothetical protein